jgi:hypothetical protein
MASRGRKKRGRGFQKKGNRQAYPGSSSGSTEFSLLVKTSFGLIQCIHHSSNLENQQQLGQFGKAFQSKVKELNSFIRPAHSGPEVQAKIFQINSSWAYEITSTLVKHYSDTLEALRQKAQRLLADQNLDIQKAKQIAISWAHRNFRKKLKNTTLDMFNNLYQDLVNSGPQTRTNPVENRPHGTGQSIKPPLVQAPAVAGCSKDSVPLPPHLLSPLTSPTSLSLPSQGCTSPPSTPPLQPSTPPLPPSTPSPPSNKASYASSLKTKSGAIPSPVGIVHQVQAKSNNNITVTKFYKPLPQRVPRNSRRQNVTPARKEVVLLPRRLTLSCPAKENQSQKVPTQARGETSLKYRAPNTDHKDRDWVLPNIPDNIRTLVIGTSNIDKISKNGNSDTARFSFPGAKFKHFSELFRKAKHNGTYSNVDKVVFSCGINDRANKVSYTTFPAFKRACNHARDLFPNAQVFFVLPNWSDMLCSAEQDNMTALKKMVAQKSSGLVHLIPALPSSQFLVIHDNIHWQPGTANKLLDHWLSYINKPSKNM